MLILSSQAIALDQPDERDSAVDAVLDDLLQKVRRSVVQVVAYRPTGPDAGFGGGSGMVRLEPSRSTVWATGVVVDERGLILTCAEAAQPGDSIQIRQSDSRVIGATFMAQDVEKGVSLILADGSDGIVPVRLDEWAEYKPGSWLAVFNHESETAQPRVRLAALLAPVPWSAGPVSNLRLDLADCAKACGGAVFDGQGRFGGMLIDIRAEREDDSSLGRYGFVIGLLECERVLALSPDELTAVCRTLEERSQSRAGFLGVRAEMRGPLDDSNAAMESSSIGRLIVVHVLAGSPAETAGILSGDQILSIGGRPVADANEIAELIAGYRPGTAIAVGLLRSGVPLVVHPRLGDRSALEWLAREEEQNRARQARLRKSIKQMEEQLRLLEQQRFR